MSEQSSPIIYQVIQSSSNHSEHSISQEFLKVQIEDKVSAIHKKIIEKLDKKQKVKLKSIPVQVTEKSQDYQFQVKLEATDTFLFALLQKLSQIEEQFIELEIQEIRIAEQLNTNINKILSWNGHKKQVEIGKPRKRQLKSEQIGTFLKNILKQLYKISFMRNSTQNFERIDHIQFPFYQTQNNNWQTQVVLQKFINQNQQLREQNQKLKNRLIQTQDKNLEYLDKIYRIGQSSPYFSRLIQNQQKQPQIQYVNTNFNRKNKIKSNQKNNNNNNKNNNNKLPETTTSLTSQTQLQIKRMVETYECKIHELQNMIVKKVNVIKQMDYQFKSQIDKYNAVFSDLQAENIQVKRLLLLDQNIYPHVSKFDNRSSFMGQYCSQCGCGSRSYEKQQMQDVISKLKDEIRQLNYQRQQDFARMSQITRNNNHQYDYYYYSPQNYNRGQINNPHRYQKIPSLKHEYRQDQTNMRAYKINSSSRIKQKHLYRNLHNFNQNSRIIFPKKSFRSRSLIERQNRSVSRTNSSRLGLNKAVQMDQIYQNSYNQRIEQMKKSLYHNRHMRNPSQIQMQKFKYQEKQAQIIQDMK